ncbi:MAG: hypothetical protein ACREC3_17590, partial [Methyloceanibacter sp.]
GEFPMNTQSFTPKIVSKFRNDLNSWISFWHFLVNLENLGFSEGLGKLDKREIQRTREARQRSNRCTAIEKRLTMG